MATWPPPGLVAPPEGGAAGRPAVPLAQAGPGAPRATAEGLLARHWGAVEAVAAALLERGELAFAEARALFHQTGGSVEEGPLDLSHPDGEARRRPARRGRGA